MTDDTATIRAAMLPDMPDALRDHLADGGRVWDTKELTEDFTVLGFAAPFVVVRRKSDMAKGSLMFTHRPRFYWGWQEGE